MNTPSLRLATPDEGFRTLALMATLPSLPLHEWAGFSVLECADVFVPDGVATGCASVEKPIA